MREIVNVILYQSRTGCQWEILPHDRPPPGAVKYYFYLWRDQGTDQDPHDLLRWHLREKRKRLVDPGLVVLDTQSVHAAVGVPADTTGKDVAKGCRAGRDAWPWTYWASSWTASCCPPPHMRTPPASPCWTVSPGSAAR
ncbi:transposase [Streptomyces sp. NPDC056708]|uniref:transposase n=1 Tax=unclassified Streptomyces TaxID=2593676 RepID=UPI0036864E18